MQYFNWLKNHYKTIGFKNGVLDILFAIFCVFSFFNIYTIGKNLIPLINENTKLYTYQTLPPHVKTMLAEFEYEAKMRNIDVSRLTKLHYIILDDPKGRSGNFAISTLNLISVSFQDMNNGYKEALWHELGHLLLNYGHEREDQNNIMYADSPSKIVLSWNQRKYNYFAKPVPRQYFRNTVHGAKVWIIPNMFRAYSTSKYYLNYWTSSAIGYVKDKMNFSKNTLKVTQNEKTY